MVSVPITNESCGASFDWWSRTQSANDDTFSANSGARVRMIPQFLGILSRSRNCTRRSATTTGSIGGLSALVRDTSMKIGGSTVDFRLSTPYMAALTDASASATWPSCGGLKLPGKTRLPLGIIGYSKVQNDLVCSFFCKGISTTLLDSPSRSL